MMARTASKRAIPRPRRILVSSAVRDGRRLIAVTMDDGNDWADHAALLDYGFAQLSEDPARRILVSSAVRDGRRLIAVTMDDGNDWADHAALLDYGFARLQGESP